MTVEEASVRGWVSVLVLAPVSPLEMEQEWVSP
jgi:hypothetical protein